MNIPQSLQNLNPFGRWFGKDKTGKESIRNRTYQVQVHRLRQDVGRWRSALDQAENVYFPNRTDLLNIYADLVLDLHLSSVMETRLINVLSRPFKLQNAAGVEQPALTKLLRRPWFRKFCALALEKIYYGHSLIEFPLPINGEFKDCELVPRQYVSPELGIVRTMPGMITGTPFRELPEFSQWLIEVGDVTDLGLLNKAAPMALYKKNVVSAWADFTEIFGMPYRAVTTEAEGEELERIEEIIANMGQASYGVFPEDVKIDWISAATANERLYDTFIDRANSELSKLILGQTMTTDSGSSRSQGEVHERVAANYTRSDSDFLQALINESLLPFLIRHGYKLQGCEFVWDESEQLPKPELFKIVQGLMQFSGYQVAAKWLESTFGVELVAQAEASAQAGAPAEAEAKPILGYHIEAGVASRNEARVQLNLQPEDDTKDRARAELKAQLSIMAAATGAGLPVEVALQLAGLNIPLPPSPQGGGEGAPEPDDEPDGPGGGGPGKPSGSPAGPEPVSPTEQLQALYGSTSCCSASAVAQVQAAAAPEAEFARVMARLIEVLYAGAGAGELEALPLEALPLYALIDEQLQGAIDLAWNAPDKRLKKMLQQNVQRFSGFKTFKQCQELTRKLYDSEGRIVAFELFAKEAALIGKIYNENYLKTEYEQAVAGAQMASKWSTFEPDGLLQYRTVGDDLVRPEHRKWDKITLPASHPWWQVHYPPNDWNCRCDTVEMVEDDTPQTPAEQLSGLPEPPKLFQHNVGATGQLFGEDHPYFAQPEKVKKAIDTQLKLAL